MRDGYSDVGTPQPFASRETRVLVVAADPHLRGRVHELVREHAIAVSAASVGHASARLRERWDGMIAQLVLPDGSGLELAKKTRASDHHVEILVLADEASTPDANEATAEGIFFGISARATTLVQRFARLCGRRERVDERSALRDLGLARRPIEVGLGLIDGRSHAEIAASLQISVRTVGSHASRVYSAAGVRGARQLAARLRGAR